MLLSSVSRSFRRQRAGIPHKGFIPIPNRSPVLCRSASDAVASIQSGHRVYVHEVAATPQLLLQALADRAPTLRNVEITGIFPVMPSATQPLHQFPLSFRTNQYFIGPHDRSAFSGKSPHARFIPMFLNEVPTHILSPDFPLDVALLSLSPPDRHGYCSLGPSTVLGRAGADAARILIAEINPRVPRTLGNSRVHYSHLDYVVETERPLPQYPLKPLTKEQMAIGAKIAELVPDRACVQAGIGAIPDAALLLLRNHKGLGVHTELFGEGMIDLIESGAVTGACKGNFVGQVTTGFVMGTDRLYNYINDNPLFHFDSATVTNDPRVIAKNPRMVAINAALQVDLTGQVNADSFGARQFSGVGGQADFARGASMSEGGIPIVALPSTAKGGKVSRIVANLTVGSSVTTSRWDGVVVVTEFGSANLWGKNTRERASALIEIAHPSFREDLEKQAFELYGPR